MTDILRAVKLDCTYKGVETRDGWQAYRWRVRLTIEDRMHEFDYWCGLAHATRKPSEVKPSDAQVPEVTDALLRAIRPNGVVTVKEFYKPLWAKAPRLREVLQALQSDASVPKRFADFCAEFGYDSDSRKAEATHAACKETAKALHKLFGEAYTDFAAHDFDA